MVFALTEAFWGPIVVAVIIFVGGALERSHARRMRKLEEKNSRQHARGMNQQLANYDLLRSIDTRTMRIDDKVDRHGEWIAAHDARQGAIKAEIIDAVNKVDEHVSEGANVD